MIVYTYPISATLNNKVNFEKLYLELQASTAPMKWVEGIKGEIYCAAEEALDASHITVLEGVIGAHDGQDASAFAEDKVNSREQKIRSLNQMAIFHPVLDTVLTVRYLTYIDNYINAYIRSGVTDVLQEKILEDAMDSNSGWFAYLNLIVNEAGNKTYEYFISTITS